MHKSIQIYIWTRDIYVISRRTDSWPIDWDFHLENWLIYIYIYIERERESYKVYKLLHCRQYSLRNCFHFLSHVPFLISNLFYCMQFMCIGFELVLMWTIHISLGRASGRYAKDQRENTIYVPMWIRTHKQSHNDMIWFSSVFWICDILDSSTKFLDSFNKNKK